MNTSTRRRRHRAAVIRSCPAGGVVAGLFYLALGRMQQVSLILYGR